mmetsp:Transcript_17383/g.44259  ORF Transcript_17383/g.44259 Transcript_17383/m.44259 type:complete len:319 (+) Transcript_17383:306-1262(+)
MSGRLTRIHSHAALGEHCGVFLFARLWGGAHEPGGRRRAGGHTNSGAAVERCCREPGTRVTGHLCGCCAAKRLGGAIRPLLCVARARAGHQSVSALLGGAHGTHRAGQPTRRAGVCVRHRTADRPRVRRRLGLPGRGDHHAAQSDSRTERSSWSGHRVGCGSPASSSRLPAERKRWSPENVEGAEASRRNRGFDALLVDARQWERTKEGTAGAGVRVGGSACALRPPPVGGAQGKQVLWQLPGQQSLLRGGCGSAFRQRGASAHVSADVALPGGPAAAGAGCDRPLYRGTPQRSPGGGAPGARSRDLSAAHRVLERVL